MTSIAAMQHLGFLTLSAVAQIRRARLLGFDKVSLLQLVDYMVAHISSKY